MLLDLITSSDDAVRNQSLDADCATLRAADLLAEADALDAFRRSSDNLYQRVRALLFLYSIHRFHLPERLAKLAHTPGSTPWLRTLSPAPCEACR